MDLQTLSSATALNNQARVGDAVGISVLRKALDIQKSGALALIESIPSASQNGSNNLPDHLGRNINVSA